MGFRIAVAGATGNVGREIVQVLDERRFPVDDLVALASERSAGTMISFGEHDIRVQDLSGFDFAGIDIVDVDVQVHLGGGLPAFLLVGLPDKTIAESRERVRAALAAIGLALPARRITVNLSPADLHKEGSHYDLPIALALMMASGVLDPGLLAGFAAMGELALDGRLRAGCAREAHAPSPP